MVFDHVTHRLGRATVAVAFAMSVFSLTACSDDTSGSGTDIEDIYHGAYNSGFYEEIPGYARDVVTVFADVEKVITPTSFVITGTDDTDVGPLLVVSGERTTDLKPELTVAVTGTVRRAFDVATVEKELKTNLDDELYHNWKGQPYIAAATIDTSVSGGE